MPKTNRKNAKTIASKKKSDQSVGLKKFFKQKTVKVLLFVLFVGFVTSVALPESSRYSYENLVGKNRGAPYKDVLSGNFSVAGEAAGSSLLIKYRSNVPESTRTNINNQLNGKFKRRIDRLGVDVVQVNSKDSVGETIKKYKARNEIEYVEPNYLAKQFLTPNDSLFQKQWHLQKIEAPKAWDISQGGYGPVAVVDTGIATAQSDLNGYVLPGYNFVSNSTNTSDDNGHGTHVAGIISAATNNSTGVASIGFKGSLMPIKVLDNTGAGTYADVSSGIIFSADKGAKIINLSLGGSSASRTMQDAVKYAQSKGVVVVAAAGNNGNSAVVYPAAYPGVIAVSATDQNDNLASFSSYGNNVYVSAPGVSIVSTYNSGGYVTMSGTSMAAPAVSGLIGLALSRGSTSTSTVINDLKSTSDKVGPYQYDQNGWNQYFGFGRINAAKLLGVTAVANTPDTTTNSGSLTNQKKDKGVGRSSESTRPDEVAANIQFDTVIEGTVDSIDSNQKIIIIKVKNSSKNLPLRENNLVDLYVISSTILRSGSNNLKFEDIQIADTVIIKAQWKDNQLNAQEIKLPARPRR